MNERYKNLVPPPRNTIGAKINFISKILRHRFNQATNEEGLFSGQQHIILLLKHNEGLTVSQVAEVIGVAPATASVSIKRMEKAGFIEKRSDEVDARITKLYLTPKGKAVPDNIREKINEQEKFITKGFTDEEVTLFSELLERALNNLNETEEKDDD